MPALATALLAIATGATAGQEVVAFRGVKVVGMTGSGVSPDRTVVVEDGLIRVVGSQGEVSVPDGARVIDGQGRYLAPGLIDFHVHLRSTSELRSYLRWGVTSIVQLSGGLSGAPDVLGYREAVASGELVGPTVYASGPILDGDPPINPGVSVAITDSREARSAVRKQAARGYDLIKVYNRLPTDPLYEVVEEAHRLRMPVVGHIPRAGDRSMALQHALDAGIDVIAHGEEFFFTYFHQGVDSVLDLGEIPWRDGDEIDRVTRRVLESGSAVIPNLSFVAATRTQLDSLETLWRDPEFEHLEPEVRDLWRTGNFAQRDDAERFSRRETAKEEFLDRLTLSFSRAGVPLLLGTDASYVGLFPGASAHLELLELVDAGLPPARALAAGTVTPGTLLHEWDLSPVPVGVIAPGARADLILVDRNPLLSSGLPFDPDGVMARGRWYGRDRLDALRDTRR